MQQRCCVEMGGGVAEGSLSSVGVTGLVRLDDVAVYRQGQDLRHQRVRVLLPAFCVVLATTSAELALVSWRVRSGVDTSRFKGTQHQLEALVGL